MRDAAVTFTEGDFDLPTLCDKLGIQYNQLTIQLLLPKVEELVQRGILVRSDPNANGHSRPKRDHSQGWWRYVKPTGPGAAAKHDIETRRQRGERAVREAVAGTGKKISAGNREVQAILNACMRQLGADKVSKAGNNHWQITHPDAPGGRVMIASTPNSAGLTKDKAKLRKLGIQGI